LQNGGVEPDIWKVEGLDAHDACVRVVRQATVDGRTGVKCIVLGRGANESKVLEWLRVAAAVPGYDGFAVGRTIWEQPLQHFLSGSTPRAATADEIADRYLEAIDGYARA
jgi:myo-inositol catabolism protein IolC